MRLLKNVISYLFSDYFFAIINYNYLRLKFGLPFRWPKIRSPATFNEKILNLKLYHRVENAHIYADKYAVRSIVRDVVGDEFLIPLLGAYEEPEQIDFSKLPVEFVLKPNHASGLIRFCDQRSPDFHEHDVREAARRWLNVDYGKQGREYQYCGIPRKIVAEARMRDGRDVDELTDFKFFCFNGKPKFIQIDVDRYMGHKRNFYDLQWQRLPFGILYPQRIKDVPRPASLTSMVQICEKIAARFVFCRIDLYEVEGRPFFGEITFHPGGRRRTLLSRRVRCGCRFIS